MIKICSHRRSGTHVIMETLNRNFEVKLTEGVSKTHEPYPQIKDKLNKDDKIVYVYRDVRDVLISCYTWWRSSGESNLCKIPDHFNFKLFTDFIKGNIKFDKFEPNMVNQWEFDNGLLTDPTIFWKKHVEGYISSNDGRIYLIKYEDLKNKDKIKELGEKLKLKQKNKEINLVNSPVGYYLGSDTTIHDNNQKWKELLNNEEKEFFKQKVGEFLKKVGYDV